MRYRAIISDDYGEGEVRAFATQAERDAFMSGYCSGANDHGGGGSWVWSEEEISEMESGDDTEREMAAHLRALLVQVPASPPVTSLPDVPVEDIW